MRLVPCFKAGFVLCFISALLAPFSGYADAQIEQVKKRFESAKKISRDLRRRNEYLRIIVDLKEHSNEGESNSVPEKLFLIGEIYKQLAYESKDKDDAHRALHYYRTIEKSHAESPLKNPSLIQIAEVCEKIFEDLKCKQDALSRLIDQTPIEHVIAESEAVPFSNPAIIRAVKVSQESAAFMVRVETDRPIARYTHKYLFADKNGLPPRFYIDLEDAKVLATTALPSLSSSGAVTSIRLAQNTSSRVRLVLDLNASVAEKNFSVSANGHLLSIAIQGEPAAKMPWADAPVEITGESVQRALKRKSVYKIVVDPGHGGTDAGAIGPGGTFEKNVCLDISLRLRELLKQNPKYEIFMTRETDKTIPLEDRPRFANKIQGDLFVSIHANASPKHEAKGVSTYFLHNADDQESLRVAMRENGELSPAQSNQNVSEDHYLEVMKASMVKNFHTIQSTDLARQIQSAMLKELKKGYKDITDLGVRSARFYVLTGAEMPAVLVETSFISNRFEEGRLRTFAYQNTIAQAIVKAIDQYFKLIEKSPVHSSYFKKPVS